MMFKKGLGASKHRQVQAVEDDCQTDGTEQVLREAGLEIFWEREVILATVIRELKQT